MSFDEDIGIREDVMDEEYSRIHSKRKVYWCDQCHEMSEIVLNDELCEACIDENFRTEIKDIIHYANESKGSLVHRYNCISMKYYNDYDRFKWCPNCENPKSWISSSEPIGYDPDSDDMVWDYPHRDIEYCFDCHGEGKCIEVEKTNE